MKDERESRGCEGQMRLISDGAEVLLARCCAAVAHCPIRCHLSSNVLRTDSEGWRVSKFWKCQARCGESRTNVDKCSQFALIVEEVLLQGGNVEERMRDGRERKIRSSSFFYQKFARRASKKMNRSPCSSRSSRCGLAAMQRGHRQASPTSKVLFFIQVPGLGRSGLYPGSRALGCGPGGTLPRRGSGHARPGDIQAVTLEWNRRLQTKDSSVVVSALKIMFKCLSGHHRPPAAITATAAARLSDTMIIMIVIVIFLIYVLLHDFQISRRFKLTSLSHPTVASES